MTIEFEKHNQILFGILDADFGYRTIFNTESTSDAIRAFADMCKNNQHMKSMPDKFKLVKLGVVSPDGKITNTVVELENATTYAPEKPESQDSETK